jgi:23S rRNA G2445 N2-methylase RlmL
MSLEKQATPETVTTVAHELSRRLAFQNIRAVVHDDGEEPRLIALDGALDNTEPAGNDTDIELVLNQMQKLFPQFTFTYDREGSIAIHNKPYQTH